MSRAAIVRMLKATDREIDSVEQRKRDLLQYREVLVAELAVTEAEEEPRSPGTPIARTKSSGGLRAATEIVDTARARDR